MGTDWRVPQSLRYTQTLRRYVPRTFSLTDVWEDQLTDVWEGGFRHFPHLKVLRDYQEQSGKEWGEMSPETQDEHRRHYLLELKRRFEGELSAVEAAESTALERSLKLQRKQRLANRDWIRKLDNMLFRGIGRGLECFKPKQRVKALEAGERRLFLKVDQQAMLPTETRSIIVSSADGQRRYECPRLLVDGMSVRPTLHVACDQGSTGWPALHWAMLGLGLRMTVSPDLMRRLHNDLISSIAKSGLMVIRLEMLCVVKMRQGPFSGHTNWSILQAAAKEFAQTCDHRNVLFQSLFEEIASNAPRQSRRPSTSVAIRTWSAPGHGLWRPWRRWGAALRSKLPAGGHGSLAAGSASDTSGWTSWSCSGLGIGGSGGGACRRARSTACRQRAARIQGLSHCREKRRKRRPGRTPMKTWSRTDHQRRPSPLQRAGGASNGSARSAATF